MIVYHSSYLIVDKPDVFHSREALDFGKGFYVTVLYEQAVRYAERFKLRGRKAFLNVFQLDENGERKKSRRSIPTMGNGLILLQPTGG